MGSRLRARLGGEGLITAAIDPHVASFAAMGTRVELHLFGTGGDAALMDAALTEARRAIEAVDDALTIHRPSPATVMNERLGAGRPARIDDPLLLEALIAVERANALTAGLFDPAAGGLGTWDAIAIDPAASLVSVARPVMLDFGGFGKGYALDRACRTLRAAGVASAFLSAGESSIAVIGQHPLGGGWPVAIPHPGDPARALVELSLEDEALSVSSTLGGAAGRSAMVRPGDGAIVAAPRTAVAVERDGGQAEAISTALLVAETSDVAWLVAERPKHRFVFAFDDGMSPFKPQESRQE